MFGLNKKKEIDYTSRINYFDAKKTIDHIKSCHKSDVQKVVLLKGDKPSNYNANNKTIYVNPNDVKQYEKLKDILVKPKNKSKVDYPKKSSPKLTDSNKLSLTNYPGRVIEKNPKDQEFMDKLYYTGYKKFNKRYDDLTPDQRTDVLYKIGVGLKK